MRRALLCAIAMTMLHGPAALADGSALSFSGFGTLGLTWTRSDDLQFIRVGIESPSKQTLDFGPDSVLGVQGNLALGARSAAVVQLVARETPYGDYQPRAALAFLSHQFTPEVTARIGRMRIPFFMLSDSIDINYAQPWVRPPVEVYGLNPFADLDGIDLLYRTRFGSTDVEVHPYIGTSRVGIVDSGKAWLSRLVGVNLSLTDGPLTVHFGHSEADLKVRWGDPDFPPLQAFLRGLGRSDILAEMEGSDSDAAFTSAGLQWDDGDWMVIGEYARRRATRYVNTASGWHLTLGRHIGKITPYLTLAEMRQIRPIVSDAISGGLPPVLAFNASRNASQRSITAGARWDFSDSAALKAEYSRAHTANDGWGSFFPTGNVQTTRVWDRRVHMLSISIDVVF